jgi:hypothetical protein
MRALTKLQWLCGCAPTRHLQDLSVCVTISGNGLAKACNAHHTLITPTSRKEAKNLFLFFVRAPNVTALLYLRYLFMFHFRLFPFPSKADITMSGTFEEICFGNKYTLHLSGTPAGLNSRRNAVSDFVLKITKNVVTY